MPKTASANFTFYPLLWLAVCFALGILAANYLALDWTIYLIVCLACAALAVIFIRRKFVLIFLFAAFVAVGALNLQIENGTISETRVRKIYDERRIDSGDPIEIEGVLQTAPELAVGGFFLTVKTERAVYKKSEIKISGSIRFFASVEDEPTKLAYEQLNLSYGSRVRVACRLRRVDDYLNEGRLSQKDLLDAQEIDATANVKSPLLIEKIADEKNFAPLGWIYERRQSLIKDFREKFNQPTAGVLIASLLGNEYFLDKQTAETFRAGGTFHVLVISGLHITFIGGLTLLLVQFFTNKRLWQFLIATIFLWSYSLAVGANVPVVRAATMFTVLLFSQAIYRSGTLLNSLGLCTLILLAWRPTDIFTSSFQLTFASVGAIVAFAFPLIEKLRAIGSWSPTTEEPFPPNVSVRLRRFCEMLYWREAIWERDVARQIWSANLFKSPYLKWLESCNLQSFARWIFEAILVSLAVQAWLLPFLIIYFHRVSPFSVVLNLWVGVVIALESFAAVFAVLFANLSDALALPLIKLTEILNWLLVHVPDFFTDNNWASFRVPHYSGAARMIYVLYFVPIIFLTLVLNRWKPFALDSRFQIADFKFSALPYLRAAAASFLFLLALVVFHPFSQPTADGRLHVDFLDVGQGDSALVTFPTGETLLVDGGGKQGFGKLNFAGETDDEDDEQPEIFEPDTMTVGESVVSNFLWARGYSQIDYILATHADVDHIQGLDDVAKNFRVRVALFGRTPMKDKEYAELYSVLKKRGIESLTVSRGDVLNLGDAKIEILYPEQTENSEAVSDNNHSVVLRIIFGKRKFLLTGDIEKEAESALLNAPEFLQTDVVKVAHHGSRTSSTENFINAANAKLAIVSVGRESQFGHPHADVIERWKAANVRVLTTGENGTVSVSTDGADLQLKTYNREKIYR